MSSKNEDEINSVFFSYSLVAIATLIKDTLNAFNDFKNK